jgi:hypothetical protein
MLLEAKALLAIDAEAAAVDRPVDPAEELAAEDRAASKVRERDRAGAAILNSSSSCRKSF